MIEALALPVLLAAAALPSNEAASGAAICRAQHALRPHLPMPEAECQEIADAANATFAPRLIIAIAIIESDFRADALKRRGRGVYDTGLMGIRCKLARRADRTTRAMWRTDAGRAAVLDLPCTNWPLEGVTLRELLRPAVSIHAAEQILLQKRHLNRRHYLRLYNGGLREHGYAARVRAVEVAVFRGRRRVLPAGSWKDERANKLTAKIVKGAQCQSPLKTSTPGM